MLPKIIESDFQLFPETRNCHRILQKREHVLIGISPFNSRFSDQYVEHLVMWARDNFRKFDILLPSEEASLLLEATGTPPVKAARKTRHQLARNLKSIYRAISTAELKKDVARIIRFSDYHNHEAYQAMRKQAECAFNVDEDFRASCLDMSCQAISGRLKVIAKEPQTLSEAQLNIAVQYIFAEIPFFLNTPQLLGVPSSLLAYHRPWPIGEGLFYKRYSLLEVNENQGYLVLDTLREYSRHYQKMDNEAPNSLFSKKVAYS